MCGACWCMTLGAYCLRGSEETVLLTGFPRFACHRFVNRGRQEEDDKERYHRDRSRRSRSRSRNRRDSSRRREGDRGLQRGDCRGQGNGSSRESQRSERRECGSSRQEERLPPPPASSSPPADVPPREPSPPVVGDLREMLEAAKQAAAAAGAGTSGMGAAAAAAGSSGMVAGGAACEGDVPPDDWLPRVPAGVIIFPFEGEQLDLHVTAVEHTLSDPEMVSWANLTTQQAAQLLALEEAVAAGTLSFGEGAFEPLLRILQRIRELRDAPAPNPRFQWGEQLISGK